MNRERQAADINQVVICGEGRAEADSQHFRKAFDVDLDETVVPADALREPVLQGSRTFRAHHQASVVIDTLAMAEEHGRSGNLAALVLAARRLVPRSRQGL